VLLASADPADPGWRPRVTRIRKLIAEGAKHSYGPPSAKKCADAAVVAPFPKLVLAALSARLVMDRAHVLRGLHSLHAAGGAAAVRKALADPAVSREVDRHGCAGPVAELLDDSAAANPAEGFLAALAEAEGTPPGGTLRAEDYLNPWRQPDWPALLAAHAEQPLQPRLLEGLLHRADCPVEALAPLGAAHPEPIRVLDRLHRPAPPELLDALRPDGMKVNTLVEVLDRSLGRTLGSSDLLHRIRPARIVLEVAQGTRPPQGPAGVEWQRFRAELAELVASGPGAGVSAWRTVREALPEFPGTVAELLAADLPQADEAAPGAPALSAGPHAFLLETPELLYPWMVLKGSQAAFVELLNAASTEVQRVLLPQMDGMTASDLLTLGRWRPEWLEWAKAGALGSRELVLLARHQSDHQITGLRDPVDELVYQPLPAEAAAALARLNDPAVNAGLIYQPYLPRELRTAVLTGRPLGDAARGRSGTRLPVDPALRASLLEDPSWAHALRAFGTGDPELTEHLIRTGRADRSPSLQLRIALGLWERNGPGALRREQPRRLPDSFDATVLNLLAELLKQAEDEPEAALARLRAATEEGESTAGLIDRLRSPSYDFNLVQAEGFVLDFEKLHAAFQRGAVNSGGAYHLAADRLCPEWLRDRTWVRLNRAQQRAVRQLAEGQPAKEVLARTPLAVRSGNSWVEEALHRSTPLLDHAAVIHHGFPARDALLITAPGEGPAERGLGALVAEHLGSAADAPAAWLVVTRLLPDFPGSLAELLATAVGVTSVAPRGSA
jgi:hypothetical protein